jgi:transcriptional regulator with XRE-family HTH domain
MGSAGRIKPEFLGSKLLAIRTKLELSQTGMANNLSLKTVKVKRTDITRYETGIREPPLIILLRYTKLAGISMEALVDDEIELKF